MNVALVHDYLNQLGGAERVFAHIARAYPEAPVYTALYDSEAARSIVEPLRVRASGLAKLPGVNSYFRYLAPLYPRTFESFDFSGFDTIVSSTTAWAKGVIVPPHAVHVCYTHTVSRFVFAYDRYVRAFGASTFAKPLISPLVDWDKRAAQRPTQLVASSRNAAQRIKRYYGRDSIVLPCPVDLDRFSAGSGGGEHFLIAARLLPYKQIDLAIRAADLARVPLLVAGTGPAERSLRAIARGTTTTMLGWVSDAQLGELMRTARAAILPGEEDFGLVPLEAAASGRPSIAFRAGGALETIVERETGEFFDEPTPESLAAVLRAFDERRYDPQRLRAHAQAFAPEIFIERLRAIVEQTRAAL